MVDRLRLLRDQGRLDVSESAFCRILDEEPGHPFANVGLSLCKLLRGETDEALKRLDNTFAEHPELPDVAIEYGVALKEAGRSSEASEVLSAFKTHLDCLRLRAAIAREQGNVPMATACLEQAYTLSPANIAPLNELVSLFLDQGLYDQALSTIQRLESVAPTHEVTADLARGRLYSRMGKHTEAISSLEAAAHRKRDDPQILVALAEELQRLGDIKRAKSLLAEARLTERDHVGANLAIAGQCRAAGDWDRAISILRKLAEDHPDRMNLRLQLSLVLNESGRREEADNILDQLEGKYPARPDIAIMRISRLEESGFLKEALGASRAARILHSEHFGLWAQGIGLELKLSESDVVRRYLDEAPATTATQRARARLKRIQLEGRDWRLADALSLGEAMRQADPGSATGSDLLFRLNLLSLDLLTAHRHLRSSSKSRVSITKLQGRSTNSSQSLNGQLYNEFSLDKRALSELISIRHMPARTRLDALVNMATQHPDHVPTAILALIALREVGKVEQGNCDATDLRPAIPKRVAQYWHEGALPQDLAQLHQSWSLYNPEYSVSLFSDAAALKYLSDNFPRPVTLAYSRSANPAQRADIFRLAYLWINGGFWADMDDRATGPLSSIVPVSAEAVFYAEEWGTIGNNFIGVLPRMRMIGWALQVAVRNLNRGDSDLLWLSTGPGLITRAFVQTVLCGDAPFGSSLRHILLLDSQRLSQAISIHVKTSYKKARRHWSNTSFWGAAKTASDAFQLDALSEESRIALAELPRG